MRVHASNNATEEGYLTPPRWQIYTANIMHFLLVEISSDSAVIRPNEAFKKSKSKLSSSTSGLDFELISIEFAAGKPAIEGIEGKPRLFREVSLSNLVIQT